MRSARRRRPGWSTRWSTSGDAVLELVAEEDGQVVGHILFSRLYVARRQQKFPAVALAPLAVEPSFHGTGIGGALVREAHLRLKQAGEKLSIVLGEPAYYGRFGYAHERASKFESDYQCEALQALAWGEAPETGRLVYALGLQHRARGLNVSRMPRYRLTSNMTARPMPAGSGRPASIRCRRRSSRRCWASAARRYRCAAPGAPMPACMRPARWRMSTWRRTGRPTRCATRSTRICRLAGEPVAILGRDRGPDDFDARFSATGAALSLPHPQPPRAAGAGGGQGVVGAEPLDAAAMHEAAQMLVGRHDFTTFRSTQCQAKSPMRTLDRLDVTRGGRRDRDPRLGAVVPAQPGRSMVGSLKRVGEGGWTAGDVKAALEAQGPRRLRPGGAAGRALSDEGGLSDRRSDPCERSGPNADLQQEQHDQRHARTCRRRRRSRSPAPLPSATLVSRQVSTIDTTKSDQRRAGRTASEAAGTNRLSSEAGSISQTMQRRSPVAGDDVVARNGRRCRAGATAAPAATSGSDPGARGRQWRGANSDRQPAAEFGGSWPSSLATPTQPTISAGNATDDGEERIPEAVGGDVEQRAGRPALPIIMRQAPVRYCRMSSAEGMPSLAEPVLEERLVDVRQRFEVGDRDALVDHVHGLADQAEFDDRAIILDEARIRRAAGGRQRRLAAGDGFDRAADSDAISAFVAGEEDLARPVAPDDVVADRLGAARTRYFCRRLARSSRSWISACRSRRVQVSLKRMLKRAVALAGMTLAAGLPTSIVVTSRLDGWKSSVPRVEGRVQQRLRQGAACRAPDCRRDADRRRGPARRGR